MGCTSSREVQRRHLRSQSMPIQHLDSPKKEAPRRAASVRRHYVSLTSSTLGSLNLDPYDDKEEEEEAGAGDCKTKMMLPTVKSPPKTPIAEEEEEEEQKAETINAWELMEGLEDAAALLRSLSLRYSNASANCKAASAEGEELTAKVGMVKARITEFQEKMEDARRRRRMEREKKGPPNGERRVVVYFTSLRGIRKTYEDCSEVRVMLQGYGVKVDERDVSLHGGFKEELNEVMAVVDVGVEGSRRLPRVFADGSYLGGAEEVRRMHETGELGKALEGCELAVVGKFGGGGGGGCDGCGDVRFVPCETCSGSCKVFVREEEEEEESGCGRGFRRCPHCNENGLIRCPLCF